VGLEELKFKNKLSPYLGLELQGKVDRTYLRGSVVYDINQGGEVGNRIGNLI
jgi:allantoinase